MLLIQIAPAPLPSTRDMMIVTRKWSQVTDRLGQGYGIFRDSVKLFKTTVMNVFVAIRRFSRELFTKKTRGPPDHPPTTNARDEAHYQNYEYLL